MRYKLSVVAGMIAASFTRQGKKQEFNWDVSELGEYVNEQSPELMEDLINEGTIKSRMKKLTGVKGKQLIKLISSAPTLQAASACGWTPEGGMILTDTSIETVRVKIQEEYCNEDLNETWAEMMNQAGANLQDEVPPSFGDVMLVYYQRKATELDENLIINGDTTSLDESLAHYNGFKKLWNADASLNVAYSAETAITAANGFDVLKELYAAVPVIVKRHAEQVGFEIICGYETAQFALDQIYADKDYASSIEVVREGGTMSFVLPTTNATVRSIQQLDGTDEAYGVCYNYMFYGTDLENDLDGFVWKYSDYDEKLRFGVKWRSGIQYIFPQYFTRLRLTPTS